MKKQNQSNELAHHAFREYSGKMAGFLCKKYGLAHIDAIGDIIQDTFETALTKWKFGATPENPGAWLMTVAKNKAVNHFKKSQKLDYSAPEELALSMQEVIEPDFTTQETLDSQLQLLLSCCHPGLSEKSQNILTLNILSGFGKKEIANGLLMKEEAVKKNLARAKKYLREEVKSLEPLLELDNPKRVKTIQTVLYLIFNEGYKLTKSKDLIDHDLCFEAIRLTKFLLNNQAELQEETNALLALQFFTVARYPSRLDDIGSIVTLQNQVRSKWDKSLIKEGSYYLEQAKVSNEINKFLLEATISSIHCLAPSFNNTRWDLIAQLYDRLLEIQPSPMTELNKVIAISYEQGAKVGLSALEKISDVHALRGHYLYYATEGEMLERIEKFALSLRSYRKALSICQNEKEKEFLNKKINLVSEKLEANR